MGNFNWFVVISTLLSPLIAINVQKFIESRQEKRKRKLRIFHTLMATRANRLSYNHVEALNSIELEYHHDGKKGEKVVEAWIAYHSWLNNKEIPFEQWNLEKEKIFINLLYEMSKFLKYSHNKTQIEKGIYSPEGHANNEITQNIIQQGLADILLGKSSFPVSIEVKKIQEDTIKSSL